MHSSPAKKKRLSKAAGPYDVSRIELGGDDTGSVPIYDSCHEIRKEIKAFFRDVSPNESAFCRESAKTFPDGRRVLTKTLDNSMKQKDPHGNQSPAYNAAYVFFEQTRIYDCESKVRIMKTRKRVWARRVNIPSRCHVSMDRISEGGHVEKSSLDNMGKGVDLGSIAVDHVHCRRGL
ncbi:uncharacterized protein EAF01_002438 [Botrytis porri]|uniref:DUF7726 domain-containing protein n=1 Tax=Botrytis porri TaxID=87229 RepID=A0A4Z1KH64_9HELO|nr:uncharacterized protein EAF01_002438 [Botrytis porri]KAF7910929.1 hypothetical protein EAF01_002438 [Botrytis porri]TGO84706.1 hypothetical protein BPOR_0475g00090 [Botrytis porri]